MGISIKHLNETYTSSTKGNHKLILYYFQSNLFKNNFLNLTSAISETTNFNYDLTHFVCIALDEF